MINYLIICLVCISTLSASEENEPDFCEKPMIFKPDSHPEGINIKPQYIRFNVNITAENHLLNQIGKIKYNFN